MVDVDGRAWCGGMDKGRVRKDTEVNISEGDMRDDLQVGDKVYIEESAVIDVGFLAWNFVHDHPYAVVRQRMECRAATPESEVVYAVEWDQEFSGGIDCQGSCAPRRGQYITRKHLSLDFEASREVVTVPLVERLVTK